jgi:hypothetical protein
MININTPRLAFLVLTLFLASCSTQLRSVPLGSKVEPTKIPPKDFVPVNLMVNVGDVMLVSGDHAQRPYGLQLEAFHVNENREVSIKHKLSSFEFSIPKGTYRLRSQIPEGKYYSAPTYFSGLKGSRIGYGGLFVPKDKQAATEMYWNWSSNAETVYQAKLASPINGSIAESIIYPSEPNSSETHITLTYAGVAANQIKFVYKEFTEEWLARPAFTQEVNLDYKAGGTYTYKSAKFSVEKADSTHISFTLLNPF